MMKQFLFLAACALAGTAAAQQIHILGGENPTMFKADNIKSITYKGDAEGYTHMVVTDKSDAKSEIALADNSAVVVMHEGVLDPTITPVEATSDEYKLLTDRQWSYTESWGDGYLINWLSDCLKDDKISFTADGKVQYDLGATNEVYCEFAGPKTFTASGEEAFSLGRKDGVLYLQFLNGAFPLYRADIKGRGAVYSMSEPYEVVKLTDTALEIKAELTKGDFVRIILNREPLHVMTPAEILCSHAWKLGEGAGGTSLDALWGELGGSMDETIKFNADGSCVIISDGIVFCNEGDGGVYAYAPTGNEAWSFVNDGNSLKFDGGAFPLGLGYYDNVNCECEIISLTSDKIVLAMPYWANKFYIILVPAE